MHLRRHKNQDQQNQRNSNNPIPVKVDSSFNWDRPSFPRPLRELALERKALQKKIDLIENRLRFGYSEPLYDYKMQLVKEDIGLSCKMTEILAVL